MTLEEIRWQPQPGTHPAVVIFMRAPKIGAVKTRLARDVGDQAALELYRMFVKKAVLAVTHPCLSRWACFYPAHSRRQVADWLGPEFSYMAQQGGDLGERMSNAFRDLFDRGMNPVVLMGTDVPAVTPGHVMAAFDGLAHRDAVVGPSMDGGYWLIGFNRDRMCDAVFSGIEWGTGAVFRDTLSRMADAGLDVHLLPVLRDIDTAVDLAAYLKDQER